MERVLRLKPPKSNKRQPVQLPKEVHAALIEAAEARGCHVYSLASKLILDGLDNLPPKQPAQSA